MSPGPHRSTGIDIRYLGSGEAEIVDDHGAILGVVNAIAAATLELCDGETTVEEMALAASDVFDVDRERAEIDLRQALSELAGIGAIVQPD